MSKYEIFDPLDYPSPPSAIDELKKLNQWVAWKHVKRGSGKPTKPPVNPHTGYIGSSTDPTNWSSYEKACWRAKVSNLAGIGFVLSDDDEYTGVDLDKCVNANTGEIDAWAQEIVDLAETYAEISPSKTGIRMFVRGKVDKSTKCDVAGVEIYRSERYLTVTGNHVDDTPEDIRPAPQTLAALLARCEKMRPKDAPEIVRQKPRDGASQRTSTSDDGARAWARAALDGKAKELAAIGEGGRNHALNASAYGMGRMVARGWIEQSEVIAALTDACKQNGLYKEDGPKGVRATLMSGLRSGLQSPHEDLPEGEEDRAVSDMAEAIGRKIEEADDGTLFDPETGEIVETKAPQQESFPDELTHVPGLVGEITEWILNTSRRPHRALALATAVTTVGTVCGRYWSGPTESATNLYVVMLAPTGSGKDHFIRAPGRLLSEAGMEELIGPKKFMSQTAVQSHIQMSPVSICPQDEFGGLLGRMMGKKASSFEGSISEELRELWGLNFGTTSTSARAASKAEMLYAICLSILGASTAEEFWKAMHGGDILNGFLNRFLIFPMDYLPNPVKPKMSSMTDIPITIIHGLRSLHAGGKGTQNDMSQICMAQNATPKTWTPVIVKWASKNAEAMWEDYEADISAKHGQPNDSSRMAYYARTAQNALRLATVLALGRLNPVPVVDVEDVKWGISIAEWSARAMMRGAGLYMSETEHQEHSNRILRIISECGGEATWRDIHQKMRNKIPTIAIRNVLDTMKEGEYIIEITDQKKKGGGHRTKRYRLGVVND